MTDLTIAELGLEIERWVPSTEGLRELAWTTGFLRIDLGEECLTLGEDARSRSLESSVLVSAVSLALWFASSIWRLLYECGPQRREKELSWRLSHHVASAGHGALWPSLVFRSDGARVEIEAQPTPRAAKQARHFFGAATGEVSLESLRKSIARFVELVLERLRATDSGGSELERLWQRVIEVGQDPELCGRRRLEAALGVDADEVSLSLTRQLDGLVAVAGREGGVEVAAARAVEEPVAWLSSLEPRGQRGGLRAQAPANLAKQGAAALPSRSARAEATRAPWHRGIEAARALRRAIGLGNEPISQVRLAELVGLRASELEDGSSGFDPALGLAIVEDDAVRLHLRTRHAHARRFELARCLGDLMGAASGEPWRPISDAITVRQKMQRAFAAEFLCPIEGLRARYGDDTSEDAVLDARDRFLVSEQVIEVQRRNHAASTDAA